MRDCPDKPLKIDGQTVRVGARTVCSQFHATGGELGNRRLAVVGGPDVAGQIQRHRRDLPAIRSIKRARIGCEISLVPTIARPTAQIRYASIGTRDHAIRRRAIEVLHCQRVDVDSLRRIVCSIRYEYVFTTRRE